MSVIINGDCLEELKKLEENSVDFVCTDPPYGYSFMGKDWDKAVPSVEIWQECLRVLKPGAFITVMSAPRSDVQMHMIKNISEAGFRVDFTPIYWTYASGFPKAGNIGKLVDKRGGVNGISKQREDELKFVDYIRSLRNDCSIAEIDDYLGLDKGAAHFFARSDSNRSIPKREHYRKLKVLLGMDNRFDEWFDRRYKLYEAEREVIGTKEVGIKNGASGGSHQYGLTSDKVDITNPTTPQAKALDGSYAGFQPKPAVEVVIVAMKPLSEKTYVDQALKNGKGISWLDDARIPTDEDMKAQTMPDLRDVGQQSKEKIGIDKLSFNQGIVAKRLEYQPNTQGRFPANLLVSDDVLNDGVERKSGGGDKSNKAPTNSTQVMPTVDKSNWKPDSGSYSRYFDLDKWASTLPFLITPKASKSEKNRGLDGIEPKPGTQRMNASMVRMENGVATNPRAEQSANKNHHPTVKPLKLMSYLITLFSREGDVVLDPFAGSGTTIVAAKQLGRKGVGIERDTEYAGIAKARIFAAKTPEQLQAEDPQTRLV